MRRSFWSAIFHQPTRDLDVERKRLAVIPAPGERLAECPPARSFAVEAELACESIEPPEDLAASASELRAADDRCEPELALAHERLRVDRQPGLPLGAEDVVGMEVLVQEDLLALRRRQLPQGTDGRVQEPLLERPARTRPPFREVVGPPSRLLGERAERLGRPHPEPWQQADQHIEGRVCPELAKRRAGTAAL